MCVCVCCVWLCVWAFVLFVHSIQFSAMELIYLLFIAFVARPRSHIRRNFVVFGITIVCSYMIWTNSIGKQAKNDVPCIEATEKGNEKCCKCVCVLFDDQNSVCSFFSFVFFGCSLAVVILSEPTTCSCSPFAYGTYMWTSKTSNQFSNERMFKHIVDLSDLISIYFYVIYIDFNFMYLHRTVT